MADTNKKIFRSNPGFSVIELLIVVAVVGILVAVAVPAMIGQRRLIRSNALGREVVAQMRFARQLAISERQSVTFEYNDVTKAIRIINHNNNHIVSPLVPSRFPASCLVSRRQILIAAGFPITACAQVAKTYALPQGGLPAHEISYGIPKAENLPPAAPVPGQATALGDNVVLSPLVGGRLYMTFQNDGSVIDSTGVPLDRGFFLFNNVEAQVTALAVSVVGASGRAKVWRYEKSGNTYIE